MSTRHFKRQIEKIESQIKEHASFQCSLLKNPISTMDVDRLADFTQTVANKTDNLLSMSYILDKIEGIPRWWQISLKAEHDWSKRSIIELTENYSVINDLIVDRLEELREGRIS